MRSATAGFCALVSDLLRQKEARNSFNTVAFRVLFSATLNDRIFDGCTFVRPAGVT